MQLYLEDPAVFVRNGGSVGLANLAPDHPLWLKLDREGCVSLLGRARRALAAGGAVLVVEMVPNDDRVSPPFPAMFAFVMLASTPCGDAWTARELQEMGRAAGFADSMVQPPPPSPQTMIALH